MVMFARQMGQPRARLYTSSAQDEQKRRCTHGTRAMLLSRGATKQTSQLSPVMLRPLRYCDMSSLLRFFISRLFRSHHFHPCTLVPRFPFSRFPFSPFQRPRMIVVRFFDVTKTASICNLKKLRNHENDSFQITR